MSIERRLRVTSFIGGCKNGIWDGNLYQRLQGKAPSPRLKKRIRLRKLNVVIDNIREKMFKDKLGHSLIGLILLQL